MPLRRRLRYDTRAARECREGTSIGFRSGNSQNALLEEPWYTIAIP